MRKYRIVSRTGEGRFATVVKAQHTKTKELFAIKCMKSSYESAEQVKSLREIQALKRLSPHPNIVKLEEVLFDPPSGRLALVFELLEGNLYELMKGRSEMFSKDAVKSYMRQIFTALKYMHSKGVFHRDIKPENILFDKSGRRLKLADFGSCRGMNGTPPLTENISPSSTSRWYRPPEFLLTSGMYGPEMDVWGAGCILFELTTLQPLFPGTDDVDMINRIHKVLGTPSESTIAKLKSHASNQLIFNFSRQGGVGLKRLLPDVAPECLDLLTQTITYDKTNRISSKTAMKHSYFVGDLSLISPRCFFNQLSTNQTAAILGFLDYKSIMRSRRVCKKFRDAAKKTIVSMEFSVTSVKEYNAMRVMTTVLPNLQQITIRYLNHKNKYLDGEDPNEEYAAESADCISHDIGIISNFRKLRRLKIHSSPLNGRYPVFFNFPLLQVLDISSSRLKWDLDMLVGLPSLKELGCNYGRNVSGNLKSLSALKRTLKVIKFFDCNNIEGKFTDLADCPRLKTLKLDCCPNVTGDIRKLGSSDFPKLTELGLSSGVIGGDGYQFQRISDVPSVINAIYRLSRQESSPFKPYFLANKTWILSQDSPDWYDALGRQGMPSPPLLVGFVRVGTRLGWRWLSPGRYDRATNSCEITWLDPEPGRESSGYEDYTRELEIIQDDIFCFEGYDQPPTAEEYNRLCDEYYGI